MLFLACVPLQPPTQPVNWVQWGLKAAIFFRGPAGCCAVPVPVVGGGLGIAFVRCSRAVPLRLLGLPAARRTRRRWRGPLRSCVAGLRGAVPAAFPTASYRQPMACW